MTERTTVKSEWGSEAELAGALMEHLQQLGWDCYPEVAVNRGGTRADLVARKGPLIWVIEAKLRFGADVLEQARKWLGHAHYVSVLVPRISSPQGRTVLTEWMRSNGVGLITADKETWSRQPEIAFETRLVLPKLHRCAHRKAKYIAEHLHPDMKRYAPGTNGGYSSPWRRTMDAAVQYIHLKPGCTIKEVVDNAKHHYHSDQSARSCLLKWLESDERVELKREGRRVTLHPRAA